jgi:hypothetical protein
MIKHFEIPKSLAYDYWRVHVVVGNVSTGKSSLLNYYLGLN